MTLGGPAGFGWADAEQVALANSASVSDGVRLRAAFIRDASESGFGRRRRKRRLRRPESM